MSHKSQSVPAKCCIHSSEFVVRLVKQLYRANQNLVVSPFGVLSSLAMLIPGADGDTRVELLKTLFDQDKADQEVAAECVDQFARSLALNMEVNQATLSIANMVYFRQGVSFSEAYVASLMEHFKVQANNLDFANKSTAEAKINADIQAATKGALPDVKVTIAPLDCLVLVGTICFMDQWEHPFNKSNTILDCEFLLDSGRRAKTAMMRGYKKLGYYLDPNTNAKAVRLTYCAKPRPYCTNLSMVLILPDKSVSMEAYVRAFTGAQLDRILGHSTQAIVHLWMPRFKLHGEQSLGSTLKALGLKDSFNLEKANFGNISPVPQLHISQVMQSAMIEVDEKGTVAAAYTSSKWTDGAPARKPPNSKPVEFYAHRPFLYVLVADSEPRQILFIGVVAKFPE